ncbi:hypothetical protein JMJ77_0002771 [Colletotrichum scovillei]|uniref:Uncharacterized protein n=1 Tax=Colletotrichum scovillei TaxID=1209932 RepID=A0A9P7RA74_9PEZI|nr:hypothetical protein JMJ77_0002771 [Colletotrichum scovillei]KAG7071196.1 hypothetical protein JMJ76_0002433 [Colletotrichum scovillei]KAG7079453.1 hypothetical protein JMJ78_0003106 [Colletotrichum scovillei]
MGIGSRAELHDHCLISRVLVSPGQQHAQQLLGTLLCRLFTLVPSAGTCDPDGGVTEGFRKDVQLAPEKVGQDGGGIIDGTKVSMGGRDGGLRCLVGADKKEKHEAHDRLKSNARYLGT